MGKLLGKHAVDIIMKGLILLSFGIALLAIFNPELIKSGLDWVKQTVYLLGNWNYLIIFISSLIESFPVLGVVIPGQNILLAVGGFFAEQGRDKLVYVVALTSIGAIIGNFIGFYLGKIYGDEFFTKYGMWFGIGETEVKFLESKIKTWGPWGITLGKFHGLTRAFIPFIAGSMGMRSKVFWTYNIIGSILRSVVMIVLGVLFAKHYESIIDHAGKIMFVIMALTALYIYKYKKQEFLKYWREKQEEMDRKMGPRQ